jgi:hypothetical protein
VLQIYEHKVDNVIMGDPPMQRLPLLVSLNLSRVQQPLPMPWQPANTSQTSAEFLENHPPGPGVL